ncbi:hypothetical protein Dimus_005956 [Dionaea muscipula]
MTPSTPIVPKPSSNTEFPTFFSGTVACTQVARLHEQLQKERDLRAALEAGLGIGQVPVSAGIDEKTKAELHEIVVAEEDLNNLKQRFHELEMQLKRQREQNLSHQHDRNIPFQEASSKGTIQ